jgi:hypothetical protein
MCIFNYDKVYANFRFRSPIWSNRSYYTSIQNLHTANEFLTTFGKEPIFKVEYVGLNEYVPANNGEYTVKTDRLLKDVSHTDLLIIPPTFGTPTRGYAPMPKQYPISKSFMRMAPVLPVYA